MLLPSQKAVTTILPSVAGVDEASVFLGCVGALIPAQERFQIGVPSSAFRQSSIRSDGVADWMNRYLSQITGEELPNPGTGHFHSTFLPVLTSNSTGTFLPSATPVPLGPRKRGQLSAWVEPTVRW